MEIRDAVFGTLDEIMQKDPLTVIITCDQWTNKLIEMESRFSRNRIINVGPAEQHAVGMAAGFATEGVKPFVFGICTFLVYRALEQIRNDVCWPQLPVTLIGSGPGLCYAYDGYSHHAVEDVPVLECFDIGIYKPADATAAIQDIWECYRAKKPNYLRMDKGEVAMRGERLQFKCVWPKSARDSFGSREYMRKMGWCE